MESHRSSNPDTGRSSVDGSVQSAVSTSSAESRRKLRVQIEGSRALPQDLKTRMLETLSMGSSNSNRSTPRESAYQTEEESPKAADSPLTQFRRQALVVKNVALGFVRKSRASEREPGGSKMRKNGKSSQSLEDELEQLAAANRASLARAHAHRVLSLPSSKLLEDSLNSELAFRQALAAQLENLALKRAIQEAPPEVLIVEEPSDLEREESFVQRLRESTPDAELDLRALFLRRLTGHHSVHSRGSIDNEGGHRPGKLEHQKSRFAETQRGPKERAALAPLKNSKKGTTSSSKRRQMHLSKMSASLKSVSKKETKKYDTVNQWSSENSEAEAARVIRDARKREEETKPSRTPFRTIFVRKQPVSDWTFEHQIELYRPKDVVHGIVTPLLVASRSPSGSPKVRTPLASAHGRRRRAELERDENLALEGSLLLDGKAKQKASGNVSPRLRLLEESKSHLFRMEVGETMDSEESRDFLIEGSSQLPLADASFSVALPPEAVDEGHPAAEIVDKGPVEIVAKKAGFSRKRSRKKRRSSGPSPELLASLEKAKQAKLPRFERRAGVESLPARANEQLPRGNTAYVLRGKQKTDGGPADRVLSASREKTGGVLGEVAKRKVKKKRKGSKEGPEDESEDESESSDEEEISSDGVERTKESTSKDPRRSETRAKDNMETKNDAEAEGKAAAVEKGEAMPTELQENKKDEEKKEPKEEEEQGSEEEEGDDFLEEADVFLEGDGEESPVKRYRGFEVAAVEVPAPLRPRRLCAIGRDEGYEVFELLKSEAKSSSVFTWGDNVKGQAGAENASSCLEPHRALRARALSGAAAGGRHSAALTSLGDLYVWGHNNKGQLGLRQDKNVTGTRIWTTPVLLQLPHPVAQIACGAEYTLALLTDGQVFAWGANECGQLGFDDVEERHVPCPVQTLSNCHVELLACGQQHSACVLASGAVFTWGAGHCGQLGHNSKPSRQAPRKVQALDGITCTQVACGWTYTLALASDGSVYSWGGNVNGCLGLGHTESQQSPEKVTVTEGVRFARIAAAAVTAAVSSDGALYVWGQDNFVSPQGLDKPLPFELLEHETIAHVTLGSQHAAVVTAKGRTICWGNPSIGRLGDCRPKAKRVRILGPQEGWKSVSIGRIQAGGVNKPAAVVCGANHTLLLSGEERYVPEMNGADMREALAAIFEAYCSSTEGGRTSPYLMPKHLWLLFLRECLLLDNALDYFAAGDIFEKAFRRQEGMQEEPELLPLERDSSPSDSSDGSRPRSRSKRKSHRRLSDLVSEPSRFRSNETERKHLVTPLHDERLSTRLSNLGRPGTAFSDLDRPGTAFSNLDRPDSAWSSLGRPDSAGSSLLRPESSGSNPGRPDSRLSRTSSSAARSRRGTESAQGSRFIPSSERLLGFEGFKIALSIVSAKRYARSKERKSEVVTDAQAPETSQPKLSDEAEVELALMDLISEIVRESGPRLRSTEGNALRIPVPSPKELLRPWSQGSGASSARTFLRVGKEPVESLTPSSPNKTSRIATPTSPKVVTPRHSSRTSFEHREVSDTEEESFNRALLKGHVALLEHRVVMDKAFREILKPNHFDILRNDLNLLHQVYAFLESTGNVNVLLDESTAPTWRLLKNQDRPISCQSFLQLLRSSGLVSLDISTNRLIEALHLGDRVYPRRLKGAREMLFPEFLEGLLLCANSFGRSDKSGDALAHKLEKMLASLDQWRDERLHPEKYFIPLASNDAVEREVTLLFSRYCGLGEVTQRVEIDRPRFLKVCRDCQLLEADFHIEDMNLLFLEATKAPPGSSVKITGLSRRLFSDVLARIAAAKYPDAPDEAQAYKFLVEKYVAPAARRINEDVKDLEDAVQDPAVIEALKENRKGLVALFVQFAIVDMDLASTAKKTEENSYLDFTTFKQLAQQLNLVPKMVNRRRLETAFRKAVFSPQADENYHDLSFAEFQEALTILAMMAYSKHKDSNKYPTPGQKVRALLDFLKVISPAKKKKEEKKRRKALKEQQEAPPDPWLTLKLDPESRDQWYWGSSTDFPLCLIREVLLPPEAPPVVEALVERAVYCHTVGDFDGALSNFGAAGQLWTAARHSAGQPGLTSEADVFIACAIGGVYESMGEDDAAVERYQDAAAAAARLQDSVPAKILPTSCLACGHYHRGNFRQAFELFLQTMVFREKEADVNASQADLALTYHNMACCLERCGQVHKAVELLEIALLLFQSELGLDHPRCTLAARNLARAQRKALGLHAPGTFDKKMLPVKAARPLNLAPLRQRVNQSIERRSVEPTGQSMAVKKAEETGPGKEPTAQQRRSSTNQKALVVTEESVPAKEQIAQQLRRSSIFQKAEPIKEEGPVQDPPREESKDVFESLVSREADPGALWLESSVPMWALEGRKPRPGTPDAATLLTRRNPQSSSNLNQLPPIISPRVSEHGVKENGVRNNIKMDNIVELGAKEAPKENNELPRTEKKGPLHREKSLDRFRIRRFEGSSFR